MGKHFLVIFLLCVISSAFSKSSKKMIIYGKDDRYDLHAIKNRYILKNAKSVALRVKKDSFEKSKRWNYLINFISPLKLSDPDSENVCQDERFSKQRALGSCSGFLVKKDVLATAAHCVVTNDGEYKNEKTHRCSFYSWMFNYELSRKNSKMDLSSFPSRNIYSCKKVIFAKLDKTSKLDFALIKLDRPVRGAAILKVNNSAKVKKGQNIYSIGHPSGLPKKVTLNAKVLKYQKESPLFEANLDSFSGGSGAPVFDKSSHKVVGIVVEGRDDYRYDPSRDCFRVNTCSESGARCWRMNYSGSAELITHIKYIRDLVPSLR